MCWVYALCCIVLVFFSFLFFCMTWWWNFPSKIKNVVYFCKRDYLCGLMPRSMVCTNSSRQERRESWRSSCPPAVAWDVVKTPTPPKTPPDPTWPLPQLILYQCSASLEAFSTHLLLSCISFCERQQRKQIAIWIKWFISSSWRTGVLDWRASGFIFRDTIQNTVEL